MTTTTNNTRWIDNIFNFDYAKYGRTRVTCKILRIKFIGEQNE